MVEASQNIRTLLSILLLLYAYRYEFQYFGI